MATRRLIYEAKDGTPHDTAKAADRHDAEKALAEWIDRVVDLEKVGLNMMDNAADLIDLLKPFVPVKPRKPRAPKAAPVEAAEKPAKK